MKSILTNFFALLISVALTGSVAKAQHLILHHPHILASLAEKQTIIYPFPSQQSKPTMQSSKEVANLVQAGSCQPVGSQPAPIAALVIALKCDPDLIFEYVYNNIEFEPLYGSNKGALGTLLDRRGNDSDQAILLTTLWNAAGYSQTGYANIPYTASGAELSNWLGVVNDANANVNENAIVQLFDAGGIPWCPTTSTTCAPTLNSDNTIKSIVFNHFIAALQLGGTWYFFDPSFKGHNITSGLSNLATAIGYSRTQFLSDVGGTIDGVSISNLSRINLRNDLFTYATNLVNYINQNNRTWSVGNIIGGKTIRPLSGSPIRWPMSGLTPSSFPVDCPNQGGAPVECRTYITIQMPGASVSQAIKLYTDQVYGHRITVFSVPSGSNYVPTLLIDGVVPACVGTGTCTNVGPATAAGSTWQIPVQVVQPNQLASASCGTGITACKTLTIAAGGSYLISTGVGQVGRGMAEYHRQLLAQAQAAGNSSSSELVLGESLAVISYNWLAEGSAEQQMTDRLAQTTTQYLFGVGITGQANIQQTNYQGPYVDLPINNLNITARVSTGPTTAVDGETYPTAFVASGFVNGQTSSAFESAVLVQTQAPVSGMTAASTIKIIDANMNYAYTGALQKTFFADGTTCAGQGTFVSTIEPAIQPYYSSTDYNAIVSAVMAGSANCPGAAPTGQQVLIPQNGQLAVGLWKGAGYTQIAPLSSSLEITQKISGGMSGGFSGADIDDIELADNVETTLDPVEVVAEGSFLASISVPIHPMIAEPVDGITGTFIYTHDDLKTGGGAFPYALPFSRTYLSSSGSYLTSSTSDTGMGNGWAHNYSANVEIDSDPYIGLGSANSPALSAATSIAALYVMQDLMSVTPTAQTMTLSAMTAQWFTDQLTSNAAFATQPNTTEEFVALPHADGATTLAFNPPPGSSVRFSQTGTGQYTYTSKDGVVSNFSPTPAGALQSLVYPNGMSVNLAYAGTQLTKVSNNLGRSLSLTYSGNDISVVTDDTGRSVQFSYDTNHNLTSFTDPLGLVSSYAYDTSGTYDTFGHLTQVFYPTYPSIPFVTNYYDGLGRVIQQANASGANWSFYFSGPRTEIVDALGNREVTYQTDRGKVLSDAKVLTASYGNVYNDTPQQNGVVNVTTNTYDGLDRLTSTTLPEGGSTTYAYATAVNPWASNVASVTQIAKPGSPLASLTTAYTYDTIWNKPTSITDPLKLVTSMSYDPVTGNMLNMVSDVGGTGHFNATSRFTYNATGQVLTALDPLLTLTTYAYDTSGNPTTVIRDCCGTGHLNQTATATYDSIGNVISQKDPNGNVTKSTYDSDRRVLSITLPATGGAPSGLVTSYTYDPDGRLLQSQQSSGGILLRQTSGTYSPTGKPLTATDARGNTSRASYDADDRLVSVADPLGRITSITYDALSRVLSASNLAVQANPLAQQAFTPDGLVASLTVAQSNTVFNTTTYTPDGFDRAKTTTFPDASTQVLTYDADSNVSSFQTRKGDTISFTYDTLNRIATKAAPSEATVTFSYDLAGRAIGISDNSASILVPAGAVPLSVMTMGYDALNEMVSTSFSPVLAQAPPTSSTATFTYSYDATNRRISQATNDNSYWSYPGATAFATSYTANNLDQYSAIGSVTPAYDGNGNLTYDGTFTYGYDAESRLISASGAGNTASYAYDAQGRRKSKTVNGTTTIFVQDPQGRALLDYNGTSGSGGTILNWYAFGRGTNEALAQVNSTTRATLIPDSLGSIIASLDAASGTLTKAGFQPYGESGTTAGTFRYTGARIDAETNGLYNMRARIYSPVLGRFMQTDPSGTNGGANLYAYVGNDPLNAVDPSGLAAESGGGGFQGGGGSIYNAPDNYNPSPTTLGSGGAASSPAAQNFSPQYASATSNPSSISSSSPAVSGNGVQLACGPACTLLVPPAIGAAEAAGAAIAGALGLGAGNAIVNQMNSSNNVGSSTYRQRALAAAGIDTGDAPNYEVHHIVAQSAMLSGPAQIAIANAGIGIHDLENLVALPTAVHQSLNNPVYYNAVNLAVTGAYSNAGRAGVSAALAQIKASLLLKGSFP